jgi:hypothetical protein
MTAASFVYFIYFILNANYKKFIGNLLILKKMGYNIFFIILDVFYCSVKYEASFDNYFTYKFFKKNKTERKTYATMGYMYSFFRKMNNQKLIKQINDKRLFSINFKEFTGSTYLFNINDLNNFKYWLQKKVGQIIVIKDPESAQGKGVSFVKVSLLNNILTLNDSPIESFLSKLKIKKEIYCEDYIQQHDSLHKISSTGVNTIRITSVLDKNLNVNIISAFLRISVNNSIDNFSAGNLAAAVSIDTGIVETGGVFLNDFQELIFNTHPLTHEPILNFQIPFWSEVILMVKKAAIIIPEVRTVGWDVCITNYGPKLMEGNTSWNSVIQVASSVGLKNILEKFI